MTKSFSKILIPVLVCICFLGFNNTKENIQITSFENLGFLDSCIKLNQIKIHQPTVLVFLYRDKCEPCNKVVEEVKLMVEKKKINPNQIVYVSLFDSDSAMLSQDVQNNFANHPFFKFKKPQHGINLPTICGFNEQGKLVWTEPAYSSQVSKRILFHVKKFQSVYNGQSIFVNVSQGDLSQQIDTSSSKTRIQVSHPIDSIFFLEKFNSITGVKPIYPTVVVYTYAGCKPCHKLAQRIKEDCNRNKINPRQVVFINPVDGFAPAIISSIKANYSIFPYYFSNPDTGNLSFPTIIAFNSKGENVWLQSGYSSRAYNKIIKHLNKR